MVPLLVIATLLAFVAVELVVHTLARRRRAAAAAPALVPHRAPAITPESVAPPAGLFLSPGNTWLRLLSNGHLEVTDGE